MTLDDVTSRLSQTFIHGWVIALRSPISCSLIEVGMVIMGIATRANGVAPPEVPLSDIDVGSAEFWLEDDDIRDGAFATLRREAPISFWREAPAPGFEEGPGHWALRSSTMSTSPAVILTSTARIPTSDLATSQPRQRSSSDR